MRRAKLPDAILTNRGVGGTLPTMNVTLTPSLEKFIERKVGQGAYASADEVIAASLAMMRTGEDEMWKAQAREKIAAGLASARAGRVHTPEEAAAWMAEQKAAWQQRGGEQ
jgi:putative addiction module CopG family antidote